MTVPRSQASFGGVRASLSMPFDLGDTAIGDREGDFGEMAVASGCPHSPFSITVPRFSRSRASFCGVCARLSIPFDLGDTAIGDREGDFGGVFERARSRTAGLGGVTVVERVARARNMLSSDRARGAV
jgi:hypothetical protein